MTALPLTSNLPPFQPRAPLRTPHNRSPKRLLFIFPYCRRLPPRTSSAACARFRLSRQKSSRIKVTTLQKSLDLLVDEHRTQMALTLQFISTLSSQLASIATAMPQIKNQYGRSKVLSYTSTSCRSPPRLSSRLKSHSSHTHSRLTNSSPNVIRLSQLASIHLQSLYPP